MTININFDNMVTVIIMKKEKVIEVKNLVKSYKQIKAIDDISFDVFQGEILGLLGPNGSGKSTTINCILSLLNFENGSIKIWNKNMGVDSYETKRKIGVVFQEVAVFDELTVYENIDYFCGLYITNKTERNKLVEEVISLVGLDTHRKFKPKQLSGGLLRRLNIACGIAHKPDLVFLDEPTVAVDPQARTNILDSIRKLNEQGATVVYTSHYMEEVEQLCDRIIILNNGKIIAQGTKDELIELIKLEEKITVELESYDLDISEIEKLNGVHSVSKRDNILHIKYNKNKNNLTNLIDYLKEEKIIYNKIYSELPSLNDVFLELTGKELKD